MESWISLPKTLNPYKCFNSLFSTTNKTWTPTSCIKNKIKRFHLSLKSFHNQFHVGIWLLTLFVKCDSISHANAKSMGFMQPIHELMANFLWQNSTYSIFLFIDNIYEVTSKFYQQKNMFCFNLASWGVKNMSC
jgi:hypothetical protein